MHHPVEVLFVVSVLVAGAYCLPQGSECHNSDSPGICTLANKCAPALKAIQERGRHTFNRCGWQSFTEIVCCPTPSLTEKSIYVPVRILSACKEYASKLSIVLSYHIVNGEDADMGEFPHMAALGFYLEDDKVYHFKCGGTLISDVYVVTAAHCIINIGKEPLKIVRLGVVNVPEKVDQPDPKVDVNVVKVTVHENYTWKEKFNDIALVKLEKTVTFSELVRPACLYTQEEDPERFMVTGWGAVTFGGNRSDVLQKAVLDSVPLQKCNSTYQERVNRTLISRQICAQDDLSDACLGDSGGPLQIQTNTSILTLVGITSYGIGCGGRYPGVYTRVSSYLEWIEKKVWP